MGREHWVDTTLDQVVLNKKGKKPKKLEARPFKNSIPYIDIEAFETGKIKKYADYESSSHCDRKDVLVVWDGARFGLTGTNQKGATGSTLACLTPIKIESSFLHKFIQHHYGTIQQKPKGMATPHVDPDIFWNLEFPLPPLNEQRHIVKKLDAILPKMKDVKERLEKIPGILKKFRQSVLASACSGRLTEDWREGKHLPAWEEIFFGKLIIHAGNGLSKRKSDSGIETIVLRLADFRSGVRIYGNERKIKLSKSEIEKYLLHNNDVLVVRVNGSRSIAGLFILYRGSNETYCDHFIRFKVNEGKIVPEYLVIATNSFNSRKYIEESLVSSAGQNTINQQSLSKLNIPLPPLIEQHEIIRQVEKLFALADSLETKYKKALSRIDKIEQSVLVKAFCGELVEPNPNDEPAEELLKRILEEKAKLEGGKKTKKK